MSTRETADDAQDARERGDIYAHMLAMEIREREDRERRAAEDIGELQRENIRLVERLQEVVREREEAWKHAEELQAKLEEFERTEEFRRERSALAEDRIAELEALRKEKAKADEEVNLLRGELEWERCAVPRHLERLGIELHGSHPLDVARYLLMSLHPEEAARLVKFSDGEWAIRSEDTFQSEERKSRLADVVFGRLRLIFLALRRHGLDEATAQHASRAFDFGHQERRWGDVRRALDLIEALVLVTNPAALNAEAEVRHAS